jgi:hypothetical protein
MHPRRSLEDLPGTVRQRTEQLPPGCAMWQRLSDLHATQRAGSMCPRGCRDRMGDGKSCTADGRCECDSLRCGQGKVCVNGTCDFCGAIGLPCCVNDFCQSFAICRQGNCDACGRSIEICCLNETCDADRVCLSNVCKDCGFVDLPCCAGNRCISEACTGGICSWVPDQSRPCM